ncbi:MAG: TetR/AcrR family transcriptional regulator [Spongiibacteraceae bacterium]|jgi:AcrR family transcriptional regulator|nr:TetR/AcrR family transcriptional regulator [Spongiibacteraceae bacterium]
MHNSSPSTYHHGNLRQALLALGEVHLARLGADNLSLRALAREIGVSQTAPYRHFADKNALLAALATDGFHRLFDRALSAARDHQHPPHQALLALGKTYVDFARQHPEIFQLMFGPVLQPRTDYPELYAAGRAAFQGVREIMEWGIREGVFRNADLAAMTNTAWAGVHGVAVLILDRADTFGYQVDPDQQVEQSLRMLMTGLLVDPGMVF